jgi:hypothetical protein
MGKIYSHLKMEERALIEMHLSMGTHPSAIAVYLGRARSTITRELIRNGWQHPRLVSRPGKKLVAGGYSCGSAGQRAQRLAAIALGQQADSRHFALGFDGKASSPRLESGADRAHTGSYAVNQTLRYTNNLIGA